MSDERSEEVSDLELAFACRSYLYELFHTLFSGEPNEQLVDALVSPQAQQALMLAAARYDAEVAEPALGDSALMRFAQEASDAKARGAEFLDQFKSDYMRYLAGPMKQDAQPWESFYVSHRHLLFQESTLAVRDFYRSFGCLPAEYPRVADDHISLECGFMAVLCRRSQEALDGDNQGELERLVEGQKRFLDEHMGKWIPLFDENLQKAKGETLYKSAVSALCEFCALDARWLSLAMDRSKEETQ